METDARPPVFVRMEMSLDDTQRFSAETEQRFSCERKRLDDLLGTAIGQCLEAIQPPSLLLTMARAIVWLDSTGLAFGEAGQRLIDAARAVCDEYELMEKARKQTDEH